MSHDITFTNNDSLRHQHSIITNSTRLDGGAHLKVNPSPSMLDGEVVTDAGQDVLIGIIQHNNLLASEYENASVVNN